MNNLRDLTLEQLIKRAMEGDIEARTLLIEHPSTMHLIDQVSNWAYSKYKQDPDEIKDFLLVKLFNSINTLKDPSQLKKWCTMMASNYCLSQIRHSNVEEKYQELKLAEQQGRFGKWHGKPLIPPHRASSPEEELLLKERGQQKDLLIEELRLHVREMLERLEQSFSDSSLLEAWAEGKTLRQISEKTGIPMPTIARRLKKMQKVIVAGFLSEIETIRGQMQSSQSVIEDEKLITRYILEGLRAK
jgi:RNA polymerase sigma factor (sigma-70 family)